MKQRRLTTLTLCAVLTLVCCVLMPFAPARATETTTPLFTIGGASGDGQNLAEASGTGVWYVGKAGDPLSVDTVSNADSWGEYTVATKTFNILQSAAISGYIKLENLDVSVYIAENATLTLNASLPTGSANCYGVRLSNARLIVMTASGSSGRLVITCPDRNAEGALYTSSAAIYGDNGSSLVPARCTVTATGGAAAENSYGVYLENNQTGSSRVLSLESFVTLTGTGGSAKNSVGVMLKNTSGEKNISVDKPASLVGTGGAAESSIGVSIDGFGSVVVEGALTATGGAAAGTGATKSCGLYSTNNNLKAYGTLTATANGGNTGANSVNLGLDAKKISLVNSGIIYGCLTASCGAAQADETHCAISAGTVIDPGDLRMMFWRSAGTAPFEPMDVTYQSDVVRPYLEITPNYYSSVSVTPLEVYTTAPGSTHTLTVNNASRFSLQWCKAVSAANYEGATALAGETSETYEATATEVLSYYFCKYVTPYGTYCSRIIPVAVATYGIALDKTGTQIMDSRVVGYAEAPVLSVEVSSTGNQRTGKLEVTLSGANADSFEVVGAPIDNIAAGGSAAISVKPKLSLASGTYQATVTVAPTDDNPNKGNITPQSFTVQFTVGYQLTVNLTLDGEPYTGQSVSVQDIYTSTFIPLPENVTTPGQYQAILPGSQWYGITINSDIFDSQNTIELTQDEIKTFNYYTVSFSANGGDTTPAPQIILQGDRVSYPRTPYRSDKMFSGWYTDNTTFQDKWLFDTREVTGTTTLHARWADPPVIEEQPKSLTVAAGASATFTVVMKTSEVELIYQWHVDKQDGQGSCNIDGATKASYTVANATTAMSGYRYYCMITNEEGYDTASSDEVTLTVLTPCDLTVHLYVDDNTAGIENKYVTLEGGGRTYVLAVDSSDKNKYQNNAVLPGDYQLIVKNSAADTQPLCQSPLSVNNFFSTQSKSISFYTVTFNGNGGTVSPASAIISSGGKLTAPAASYGSYACGGWYKDAALTQPWDFAADKVWEKQTLYAGWGDAPEPVDATCPKDAAVPEKNAATFTSEATGETTVRYQWQVSADHGASWSNITTATSASYTVASATAAMNGYQYRCLMTNLGGTTISRHATLTVQSAVDLFLWLDGDEDTRFRTAKLVAADDAEYPMTKSSLDGNFYVIGIPAGSYKLYLDGEYITSGIAAVASTYQRYDINFYTVTLTQNNGAATPLEQIVKENDKATDPSATLDNGTKTLVGWYTSDTLADSTKWDFDTAVTAATTLYAKWVQQTPVFTTNPQSQSITMGNDVTFTALADGDPAPSYRWQELSPADGAAWTDINGATGASYTFKTSSSMNHYQYRCAANNGMGGDAAHDVFSDPATLSIVYNISIYNLTLDGTLYTGELSLKPMSGGAPITLTQVTTGEYSHNDLPFDSYYVCFGSTQSNVAINTTVYSDKAFFTVTFDSNGGDSTPETQIIRESSKAAAPGTVTKPGTTLVGWYSDEALTTKWNFSSDVVGTMTLYAGWATAPAITISSEPTGGMVHPNGNITFDASATGLPSPSYQWQRSDNSGASWENISEEIGSRYVITGVSASMNGKQYRCQATNSQGTATSNVITLSLVNSVQVNKLYLDDVLYTGKPMSLKPIGGGAAIALTEDDPATGVYSNPTVPIGSYILCLESTELPVQADVGSSITYRNHRFYTVAFEPGGGTPAPASVILKQDSLVPEPAITKSGASLLGWYSDAALTNKWNFAGDTVMTKGLTLYASWATAPAFTTQPTNTFAVVGQNATLTAIASGTPAPTLQWQEKTTAAGADWTNLSGENSAELVLTSVALGKNGYQYRCVANNGAGGDADHNVFSNAVTLTVGGHVGVTVQKDDQPLLHLTLRLHGALNDYPIELDDGAIGLYKAIRVPAGDYVVYNGSTATDVAITVDEAYESASLDYYTVSFHPGGYTPEDVPNQIVEKGRTAAQPTITRPSETLRGWYTEMSLTTLWSFATPVDKTLTLYAGWDTAPVFATQPANCQAKVGDTAGFYAEATCEPRPDMQWQVKTVTADWTDIPGATGTDLNLTATLAMNGNQYRCVANNGLGGDANHDVFSTPATLTIVNSVGFSTTLNGQPYNDLTTLELRGASVIPLTVGAGATNFYSADNVPVGGYTVYKDGATTGKQVTVADTAITEYLSFYTVTFDSNGGAPASLPDQIVAQGLKASQPTVTREGASLRGWYKDLALTQPWDFDDPVEQRGFTLYAGWNIPPAFADQPQNQSVQEGENAAFWVTITGDPAPSVQWQVRSTAAGADWTNLTGENLTTLGLSSVTLDMSGCQYRCVVNNGFGGDADHKVYSEPATLTVSEKTYTVTVSLTKDGSAYTGQTAALRPATGGDLSLPEDGATGEYKSSAVHEGDYTVYVNGASTGKTLTVSADCAQTISFFTVTFDADGGTPAPAQQLVISGQKAAAPADMTNGTLTFDGWYLEDTFTTKWRFDADTVTAAITLTARWLGAPAFTADPQNKTVTEGQTVTFTAEASGVPAPSYAWQVKTPAGTDWVTIPLATGSTLTLTSAKLDMNGNQYRCVATNPAGSANSAAATLTVTIKTYKITIDLTKDGQAYVGAEAALLSTTGDAALTQSASVAGRYENPAVPAGDYSFYTRGQYTGVMIEVTDQDIGRAYDMYTVSFEPNGGSPAPAQQIILSGETITQPVAMTNGALTFDGWYKENTFATKWNVDTGKVTETITLYASWTSAPAFTEQPINTTVTEGQTATFTAAATGTPAPGYQWQVKTAAAGADWADITGATGASYTTQNTTLAMNGCQYRCVATNIGGSKNSDTATLTVTSDTTGFDYAVYLTLNNVPLGRADVRLRSDTINTLLLNDPSDASLYKSSKKMPEGAYQLYVNGHFISDVLLTQNEEQSYILNTVTFEPNGGAPAPAQQLVIWPNNVTAPAPMTKAGYSFGGWFSDDRYIKWFDFETMTVSDAITLYARWGDAFEITQQPQSQVVGLGSKAEFSVAVGGVPGVDMDKVGYQWQRDEGMGWRNYGSTDTFKTTLAISKAEKAQNGLRIRCVITYNGMYLASDIATLHVLNDLTTEVYPRDEFSKGEAPKGLTVIAGHGLPGLTVANLAKVTLIVGSERHDLIENVHYTATTGGSIHIVPSRAWLNTFAPGTYTIELALKGGAYAGATLTADLTVATPVPVTGDTASPAVWLGLMMLGLCGAALLAKKRRRVKE